jgi:hypothetical protein
MAWERVAAWVESQRLDTLRRFEDARVDADSALASGVEESWAGRPPAERAALRRLKRGLETEAGRFAAEEVALALNISVTRAQQQLTLARDLQHVHRELREALALDQVSGFVASMVAQATRRLPDAARVAIDDAVTSEPSNSPPVGRSPPPGRASVRRTTTRKRRGPSRRRAARVPQAARRRAGPLGGGTPRRRCGACARPLRRRRPKGAPCRGCRQPGPAPMRHLRRHHAALPGTRTAILSRRLAGPG